MKEKMSLKGRTIIVTGGARGVGKILELAAAGTGADVVVHYGASKGEAQATAEEIRSLGVQAFLLQADLNKPQEAAGFIERAQEFGPLFALVNSAAIFERLDWKSTTLEAWNRHLMVNLTAPFLLSQAFANALGGARGRIINIVDWRWQRPGADHLPYAISKSALAALTQSLAMGMAPDITVNALALGAILPPSDGAAKPDILLGVPARRWAAPQEVADAIRFLLTGPEYITGEIIYVDGGEHLL